MVTLTPKQASAIAVRVTATCTAIDLARWSPDRRAVVADYFDRGRLIESVRVEPGGRVTVLP